MTVNLKLLSIGPGIPCPECKHGLGPLADLAAEFFERRFVDCKKCKFKVNLWTAACEVSAGPAGSFFAPFSLGAKHSAFVFELACGEHKEIDLIKYGIPEDATILDIAFTPQGGNCFPVVKHGNKVSMRFMGSKVLVYGMALGDGGPGGSVCAGVTWIREEDSTESWLYFTDAFEAITSRKYWHVVLPAHVGFEVALIPLIKLALERHVSKERVKDFVNSGLTISVGLNVVLPLLCEISQVPRMPDDIRGQLNHLRDLRNKLVHEGLPKESVTEQLAGEMLCAAMFGFEYVRFARSRLLEAT